jgi:hypothetical protein
MILFYIFIHFLLFKKRGKREMVGLGIGFYWLHNFSNWEHLLFPPSAGFKLLILR